MKSLRHATAVFVLLLPIVGPAQDKIKPAPLDRLDPEKIPADTRKLLDVPGLVAYVRGHNRAIAALAFAPDGRRLASSSWDNKVAVWQLDGAEPKEIARVDGSPSGIAFTADGTGLVTGSPQSKVVIWDLSGAKPKVRVNLSGHKYRPFALQIAPGGKMLASGSLEPVLRLWKFEGNEAEIWAALANEDTPSLGIGSLSFSGDGKLLAAGSQVGKQTLRIWEVSGNFLDERTLPAAQARTVQFSPAAPVLAFAGDDALICLWSVVGEQPKELHVLKGHKDTTKPPAIKALAFAPSGALLASGGADRRLILWDAKTGKKLREWQLLDEVRALAFAPDGRHLAVGNDDGTMYVLRLAGADAR